MTRDERRAHRPIQLTVTETVGGWVATWSVCGFTHPEMGAIAPSKREAVAWAHKFFRRDIRTNMGTYGPLMMQSQTWFFLHSKRMVNG